MAPLPPPPPASSSSSSWQPAQHTQASTTTSITGHHVRARMAEKASQSREYWTSVKQRASDLKQQAGPLPRTLGRSFSTSLLTAAGSSDPSSSSSSSISSTAPGSQQQDHVFPVLLPGYTFARPPNCDPSAGEDELHLVLRGFVARRPAVPGRGQRMFALMARQLARLPKPLAASSSGQLLLHPRPSSTDDAQFWPGVPTGSVADGGHEKEHQVPLSERIVEEVADRLDERTIGKLVEKMGALPIDGEGGVHDEPEEMTAAGSSTSSGSSTPALVPGTRHHLPQLRVQSQDLESDLYESMGSEPMPRSPETMLSQTSTRSSATDLSAGTAGSASTPSRSSTTDSHRPPTRTLRPTALEPSASTSTIPASRLSRLRGLTPLSSTSLASTRSAPATDATTASGAPGSVAADSQLVGGSDFWARRTLDEIHALTANLNERLADFWLYRVNGRGVRIEVEGCFLGEGAEGESGEWRMLLAQEVKSDAHGMFRLKVNVGPVGVFGDDLRRLRCRAVLPAGVEAGTTTAAGEADGVATEWLPLDLPAWRRPPHTASAQTDSDQQHASPPPSIRLVSDIDDTVRQTNVTSGLKSVFRQVFVLPHDEVAVPGMAEWYRWLRGCVSHTDKSDREDNVQTTEPQAAASAPIPPARHRRHPLIDGLHFVSNAPVELWRPVTDFLRAAGMPEGAHLHLKSYNSEVETSTSNAATQSSGGEGPKTGAAPAPPRTSLLSTWLQPASQRKRSAIVSILDDFPRSFFLLVGDTGELDLELYAELAKERPHQVRGLYLRDVSSPPSTAATKAEEGDGQGHTKSASRRAGEWVKAKRPTMAGHRAMTVDESILAGGLTGTTQATSAAPASTATISRVGGAAEAGGGTNSAPSSPRLLGRLTKDRPHRRNNTASAAELDALSPLGPPAVSATRTATTTTTTTMGPPASTLSPALQSRMVKARAMVPPSCELRLFRSGEDVRVESERLIERLREEGAARHQR